MYESLSLTEYLLSYPGIIVALMFSLLMILMLTGQRVFGVMGFIVCHYGERSTGLGDYYVSSDYFYNFTYIGKDS